MKVFLKREINVPFGGANYMLDHVFFHKTLMRQVCLSSVERL
jgi:hypothetical protein